MIHQKNHLSLEWLNERILLASLNPATNYIEPTTAALVGASSDSDADEYDYADVAAAKSKVSPSQPVQPNTAYYEIGGMDFPAVLSTITFESPIVAVPVASPAILSQSSFIQLSIRPAYSLTVASGPATPSIASEQTRVPGPEVVSFGIGSKQELRTGEVPPLSPTPPQEDADYSFSILPETLVIRVDSEFVARTVDQLLAGFDTVVQDQLNDDAFWLRLGYWVIGGSASAVAYELIRQELRSLAGEQDEIRLGTKTKIS